MDVVLDVRVESDVGHGEARRQSIPVSESTQVEVSERSVSS